MPQSLKFRIGQVLTSGPVYKMLVKPSLKNDCVRTSKGLIDVRNQSRYIQSLLFWRIYENSERRLIEEHLERDCPVIELGASIGMTTLTICRSVDPSVPVITVEANPILIPNLQATRTANQLNHLEIINAAVDYGPAGEVSFIID